jgi:hypothetical protein
MVTGTADTPEGFRAILTQIEKVGNFRTISFTLKQSKGHKKNYSPFLLEADTAICRMEVFDE